MSDIDLSTHLNELLYSIFDSTTIWPNKMPDKFIPNEIMKNGKNPGLNIKKLHKSGLDGKGISIGIIDGPILTGHSEFTNCLTYYDTVIPTVSCSKDFKYKERFHGNAVASIATGKNIGVAPGAKLYYVSADSRDSEDKITYQYYAEAINKLLDINKQLPENKKIRAISISWSFSDENIPFYKEAQEAIERAVSENVIIFCTDMYKYMDFTFCSGADRNPLGNPDNLAAYSLGTWEKNNYEGHKDGILFPMDSRSFASPTGVNDYAWVRIGGWSWVMPYITGLYAICLQINPNIIVEEFSNALSATADTIIVDNLGSKVPIHIVNPIKLSEYVKK